MSDIESRENTSAYKKRLLGRSKQRWILGLVIRWIQYIKNSMIVFWARQKGATIGENVVMPFALARRANANLIIGSHTSIQSYQLDLRNRIEIGSYVIIGAENEFLTQSHNIDSVEFEVRNFGLRIEDYVWISTKTLILPTCRNIEFGAVVGAGSVVHKNVERMSIVSGNPAVELRKRKEVWSDLCVESLRGGDYKAYYDVFKSI